MVSGLKVEPKTSALHKRARQEQRMKQPACSSNTHNCHRWGFISVGLTLMKLRKSMQKRRMGWMTFDVAERTCVCVAWLRGSDANRK